MIGYSDQKRIDFVCPPALFAIDGDVRGLLSARQFAMGQRIGRIGKVYLPSSLALLTSEDIDLGIGKSNMSSTPLALGQFNHINLSSADLARAEQFYVELLGFRVVPRPSFSFDGRWLYREEVGPMIHLNHVPDHLAPTGTINPRGPHFAIQSSNVQEIIDRLCAAQIEFAERSLPGFGYRQVFFRDPDGNLIEIGEWPEPSAMVELHENQAATGDRPPKTTS